MNNNPSAAYSLIEVLFVVLIFSIIGLGIIQISNFSWQFYSYNKSKSDLQRHTITVEKLATKVRNAVAIKINSTGNQLILREKAANNKLKYSRYLLKNNNLYLQTNNTQLNFIKNWAKFNNWGKTIIGQKIIGNTNVFSITANNLLVIKLNFKQKLKLDNQSNFDIKHTINRKIYPRNKTINLNLKNSEVKS